MYITYRSETHKSIENAFYLDKTGQNVQILEEVLFFKLRRTLKKKKKEKQTIYLACVS